MAFLNKIILLTKLTLFMKTKFYLLASMIVGSLLFAPEIIAQEKYQMVELTFIMPKIGSEKTFETAIKEHNDMYHKEVPYKASLDYILTGKQAGWYVWLMGPCTFTDLDGRPEDDAHRKHWTDKVSPTVAKYGSTEYWKHNAKLSYQSKEINPKIEEIWFADIKKGDYYKFKDFVTKIKAAFEKKADGNMNIYENQFSEGNGRQIAIVWAMDNFAEMDKDTGGIKKEYEEIYGEGSWANAMDDWLEIIDKMSSQLWRIGI